MSALRHTGPAINPNFIKVRLLVSQLNPYKSDWHKFIYITESETLKIESEKCTKNTSEFNSNEAICASRDLGDAY